MHVDGRALAAQLQQQLTTTVAAMAPQVPRLGIVACNPDTVTGQYLHLKQTKAEAVGIAVQQVVLSPASTTAEVVAAVEELAATVDGLVVQLPLPPTIDRTQVLAAIPSHVDVDALRGAESQFVSPVARAMAVILHEHNVTVAGKQVLVFGAGTLVGQPAAAWFRSQGATVSIMTADDTVTPETVWEADIVVLGAGHPGLLTPEMVTANMIVLDAGTSEASGRVRGDADPACAAKVALFTPVPGGIGPITIATLLENVVQAAAAS